MDTLVFIFWGVFFGGNLTTSLLFSDSPCVQSWLPFRQEVELTSTSAQAVTTKHEVQVVPERIFVAKQNRE